MAWYFSSLLTQWSLGREALPNIQDRVKTLCWKHKLNFKVCGLFCFVFLNRRNILWSWSFERDELIKKEEKFYASFQSSLQWIQPFNASPTNSYCFLNLVFLWIRKLWFPAAGKLWRFLLMQHWPVPRSNLVWSCNKIY